jgi:SAM-dependent methyltransferase
VPSLPVFEDAPLPRFFSNVSKCEDCGFVFAGPDVGSSDPTLYDEDWAKSELHPTFVYSDGRFIARNADKLTAILDRLAPIRETGRKVDVGCSDAFFLMLSRERGWDVRGVEVSDFGVDYSRDALGIDVYQGTLQQAAFPDNWFDIVFNSHVIEHIADPCGLLREMSRILRPGGALVTVLPTQVASPGFCLFGKLTGEVPPRHVSFFTKRTFHRALSRTGFGVVHSAQNIEILKIYHAIRGTGRDGAATPEVPGDHVAPPSPGPHATIVRGVKSLLNSVGSLIGMGDELTTVAVKRATGPPLATTTNN